MAIAGKVAITPKGNWSASTAYQKLDLVYYNNASYVAIQPSTGVTPTNTSYWMLVLQSENKSDIQSIINGETKVGDADKLDGHNSSYFAKDSDLAIERERITNLATLTEGSTTGDAELADIRVGADGKNYENAGEAVRGQVSDLKSDLSELETDITNEKVGKFGANEVTPYNLQGFEPTGNLVSYCELIEGAYISWSNTSGKLETALAEHAGYNTYILAVEKNTDYSIQVPRVYALLDDDKSTIIGGMPVEVSSGSPTINSGESSYIAFSWAVASARNASIVKGKTVTDDAGVIILPEWLSIHTQNRKHQSMTFNGTTVVASNNVCSLKSGIISFSGTFDSFTQLDIVLTTQDRTNGTVLRLNVTTTGIGLLLNGSLLKSEEHGLTITNTLSVKFEWFYGGTVKVMLYTTSGRKSFTCEGAYVGSWYFPFIYLGGTNATAKTSFTSHELRKPTYVFGDSYLSYGGDRWGKYVDEMSTNALVNAYAGETSEKAYRDLETVLAMGIPKYLVWCLGMNDGSDTDENTPSANWVTYRDKVIEKAKGIGCELIFTTIPTVPNINHEGKNAWIRNSGYRYIDFAQAVGASADGTWYDGLLSSDNVHPTGSGAVVLGGRVLTDFPELAVIY